MVAWEAASRTWATRASARTGCPCRCPTGTAAAATTWAAPGATSALLVRREDQVIHKLAKILDW